jgi:very-short-patch-repair endonuclease
MEPDDTIRAIASRQRGLITIEQIRGLGLTPAALRHRVTRGEWIPVSRRVLRSGASPWPAEARVLAAVLHAGPLALAARHTAAALWGLPGFDLEPVQTLVPHQTTPRRSTLGRVHTTRDLLDTHRADMDGIPLTTPTRTIFDLAQTAHPKRVERALDTALARHLLDVALLRRTLDELADRGRTGISLMRELIAERSDEERAPESGLEARVVTILANAGEAPLRRQVEVGGAAWVGRVDFADAELPVVVEVQSERFHGSLADRRHDAARRRALEDAGFLVGEVAEQQVWHRPDEVVDLVRVLRRRARALVLARDRAVGTTGSHTRTA